MKRFILSAASALGAGLVVALICVTTLPTPSFGGPASLPFLSSAIFSAACSPVPTASDFDIVKGGVYGEITAEPTMIDNMKLQIDWSIVGPEGAWDHSDYFGQTFDDRDEWDIYLCIEIGNLIGPALSTCTKIGEIDDATGTPDVTWITNPGGFIDGTICSADGTIGHWEGGTVSCFSFGHEECTPEVRTYLKLTALSSGMPPETVELKSNLNGPLGDSYEDYGEHKWYTQGESDQHNCGTPSQCSDTACPSCCTDC